VHAHILEKAHRRPDRAGDLLEQLLEVERDRGDAYATATAAALRREKTKAGAFWATRMREHGLGRKRATQGDRKSDCHRPLQPATL
jgi:hypothetical protein